MDARDVLGQVFRDGSAALVARVVDVYGEPIEPEDVESAEYTIHELDLDDESLEAVEGHEGVELVVEDVVLSPLVVDDLWGEVDDEGYNLRVTLGRSETFSPFPRAGVYYQVSVTLTLMSGQEVLARFRVLSI